MKRKIFSILFIVLLLVLTGFGGLMLYRTIQKQSQPPVSMIIASDIHYLSPEYRGEYFKEPASYFDGKLTHYSPEYFDAFLSEVIKNRPLSAGKMVCILSFAVFGYIWEIPVVFAIVETVSDNEIVRYREQ